MTDSSRVLSSNGDGSIAATNAPDAPLPRRGPEMSATPLRLLIAAAQSAADAPTAASGPPRLQSITAALNNTVTQDAVASPVLREAIVALECDAGGGDQR